MGTVSGRKGIPRCPSERQPVVPCTLCHRSVIQPVGKPCSYQAPDLDPENPGSVTPEADDFMTPKLARDYLKHTVHTQQSVGEA